MPVSESRLFWFKQLPLQEFEAHRESVRCVSFSPSDLKFATASTDSTLKVCPAAL